jgi:hypothetical protein
MVVIEDDDDDDDDDDSRGDGRVSDRKHTHTTNTITTPTNL